MKKFSIYYFCFLFFFLSFFVSGIFDSQDGLQYLAVARNIYYKGEPTAPTYEYDTRENIHMSTYVGKDGKTYGTTGLGYSLALVPAVAITDIFYKLYNILPTVHFPLESDWLIFFVASFTNALFAAGLGVILYHYLREIKLSKKQAVFISFISLIVTNLFALSKHSFAHMMFVTFLVLSFFLLKKYSKVRNRFFLLASGISYGIVIIAYNQTYLLPLLPLVIYYLLLLPPFKNKGNIKSTKLNCLIKDLVAFTSGALPFFLINFWFNSIIARDQIASSSIGVYTKQTLASLPPTVFIEGLYGQLLSPGRSIFLYSPLLLILIFFGHKIKKRVKPELVLFLLLSVIYILFYSTPYSYNLKFGFSTLWHGESSWGPRYLSPLIPFGMLIVGHIFQRLTKKQKLLIFYPLLLIGLYVEMLGVLMPYQIKFHELEKKFFVNKAEYTASLYSNLLPRYSPVLMMSKKLVKLYQGFPKTLDHGDYNVRFYDGIDFAFNVGPERWRSIEGTGYISFDNFSKAPVEKLRFDLINHPIIDSSSSAQLQFNLNENQLFEKPITLDLRERKTIDISINRNLLIPKNNQLIVNIDFGDESIIKENKQILGLIFLYINDESINKESIDVPYISDLGPKMTDAVYKNWGGTNKDPWKGWHIHTQVFERTPDFWWLKPLYYWDIPNKPFLALFVINISAIYYFGRKAIKDVN